MSLFALRDDSIFQYEIMNDFRPYLCFYAHSHTRILEARKFPQRFWGHSVSVWGAFKNIFPVKGGRTQSNDKQNKELGAMEISLHQ